MNSLHYILICLNLVSKYTACFDWMSFKLKSFPIFFFKWYLNYVYSIIILSKFIFSFCKGFLCVTVKFYHELYATYYHMSLNLLPYMFLDKTMYSLVLLTHHSVIWSDFKKKYKSCIILFFYFQMSYNSLCTDRRHGNAASSRVFF